MKILNSSDKEKIKRVIPKTNNKVIDATVARLYVAYPDFTQWQYTGLVGAVVLVDDLVGHTFFLKLVDILGQRGVIWDQELYVDFKYHQDRTFFHTFEIEECLVGLLFEDTSDASHFYKRVTLRTKYGSKHTVNNKNAIALKEKVPGTKQSKIGPRGEFMDVNTTQRSRRSKGVLYYDDVPPPEWRSLYAELEAAGISENMIADNREFIKDYIAKQGGPLVGLEPPIPRRFQKKAAPVVNETVVRQVSNPSTSTKHKKAPPPPPPAPGAPIVPSKSPELSSDVYSSTEDFHSDSFAKDTQSPSASQSSLTEQPPQLKFRLPPANAVPPPIKNSNLPPPSTGINSASQQSLPGTFTGGTQPGLPNGVSVPPSIPVRQNQPAPPPPPARNAVPPMPPPRSTTSSLSSQRTGAAPPPPPPPRATNSVTSQRTGAPPPPPRATRPGISSPQTGETTAQSPVPLPPQRTTQAPPISQSSANAATSSTLPPPLPPTTTRSQQPPPSAPQLPPQLPSATSRPSTTATPATTAQSTAPPPPPLPPAMSNTQAAAGAAAPPPPPPLPAMDASNAAAPTAPTPALDPSRDALLASIRAAGVGSLKKTDKSQLEKPSVLIQEAKGEHPSNPVASGAGGAGGDSSGGQPATLADALASALNKRKGKVAGSDDEDDGDDW